MKTKNKSIITAMDGMDAVVSNNNEVFAKQKLQRIKLTWMSILFAITLSFAITACEKEKEDDPVLCKCAEPKEHLFVEPDGEPCCDGEDCNCGVYYGVLPNGVKIYKGAGVTDAQAVASVPNIIAGYNNVEIEEYGSPDGKFTKVVIISSEGYTWDGSVLGLECSQRWDVLGADSAAYYRGRFERIAADILDPIAAQLQTTNNIKLADNALTKSNRFYC
jgi:hypothetical protein